MKNQKGFTLIELVVVIVVLGILAAVAVPKFVDLQGDARDAAVKGVAGNLSSASALNYAAKVTNKLNTTDTSGGCTDAVANLLVSGGSFGADATAGDYGVTAPAVMPTYASVGDAIDCTITDNNDGAYASTFNLIYAD